MRAAPDELDAGDVFMHLMPGSRLLITRCSEKFGPESEDKSTKAMKCILATFHNERVAYVRAIMQHS